MQVLAFEGDAGIERDRHDLGIANSAQCIGNGKLFELLCNPGAAAHASCVPELDATAMPDPLDADGVARDASLGASHHAVFAEQKIDQRGFADVGSAHNGDAQRRFEIGLPGRFRIKSPLAALGFIIVLRLLRVHGISGVSEWLQGIIEIGEAFAVFGRKRDRRTKPQLIGFHTPRLPGATFAFVGGENDGCRELAEYLGETLVQRSDASARIHQQKADIGLSDGGVGLATHARFETVVVCLFKPGSVDDGECEVAKTRLTFATVTRDAGGIIHQCQLLADEPVKQRGLADIRPSHNGDLERHLVASLWGSS